MYMQLCSFYTVTYRFNLVTIVVLFVITFMAITPKIFVLEASNFTEKCICVVGMCMGIAVIISLVFLICELYLNFKLY